MATQEHVDLGGTTPPNEPCAQVGSREYDYHERARTESKAFIALLVNRLSATTEKLGRMQADGGLQLVEK